ncbi:hypothetical protein ABZ883_41040 [Streptomyces sp. NPDC046977]|uniref:hypothetical protein n=1 Tax=Streptomyces sp. NPDC046977 TaxID=3154703 RepID=UPI0033C3EF5A
MRRPVLKDTGDAFWVAVDITNTSPHPATIKVTIRLSGPWGYNAVLDLDSGVLEPGGTRDGVYTAHDYADGAVIPERPTVVVVEVLHAPA